MTTRVTVHRINMERYKSLLMGDLTPYERLYLEQQIENQRAAMQLLYGRALRGSHDYPRPNPRPSASGQARYLREGAYGSGSDWDNVVAIGSR